MTRAINFDRFHQELEKLFKQDLSNENITIREAIYTHCTEKDVSRLIQDLMNIINKYYGKNFMLHLPVFTRKENYSYVLILSLTLKELKLLLLGDKNYTLVLNRKYKCIEGQEEIQEKIKTVFGHRIELINKNDTLLSLMKINNKKRFFELFNEFESIIYEFLQATKCDKVNFYEELYKYIIWDYEDSLPYIPVTFLLSLPYSVLYETILSGKNPEKNLIISEV